MHSPASEREGGQREGAESDGALAPNPNLSEEPSDAFHVQESKYYCREAETRASSDPSFTAVALIQPVKKKGNVSFTA